METKNEPRRIVPPRLPPVANCQNDRGGGAKCPHCWIMVEEGKLMLHIYVVHELLGL